MAEMATTRSTEIANRIGQLETNSVSDHVARDGPAAEVDQRLVYPGASSSRLNE